MKTILKMLFLCALCTCRGHNIVKKIHEND